MSLSYREKQTFFQQLGQLIRAGKPLAQAATKLGETSNAPVRRVSRRLVKLLESDRTASEAFEALRPELASLERSTLSALARSGRLELGLQRLADYYGVLAKARAAIIRQSAYPLFILHVGVLLLNVQVLMGPGGLKAYAEQTFEVFALFYGALLVLAVVVPILNSFGAQSGLIDALLRLMPFFGKARRALAVSRFCGTLDLQLDAGVNVIQSLQTATEAAQSGLIHQLNRRALPRLRAGDSIGALVGTPRGALPSSVVDSILLGEETGELHRVLPELRAEYEEEGLRRLSTAAEWIPRLLYFGILLFLGYRIIKFYIGYMNDVSGLIDAM